MSKINKPIIFIPIEITVRELDYKVNLARLMCNAGFDVIIGNPPFIRDELKYKNYKGAFLEKGVNPDPDYYRSLKNKEILLYCLSDEGAAYPAFSVTYPPAVEALKTMDDIFLWGCSQMQDLVERNKDVELCSKYKVTGYPGIDFSLPFYKDYHKELKPKNLPLSYILVNTNFGSFNGFDVKEIHKACTAMSPETAERLMASYKKEEICFKYFYKSITEIIKNFPSHQFLIRPHPVEKEELYIKYFEMFNNVVVSKNGTINQLISGAELVIHSDCTSALQAYLMQVPVISVAYPYKDMICAPWSLSFGETPQSVDDIKELINCMLVNKNFPSNIATKIHKNAKKTIETMFGNIGNSSEEIASIMTAQISERFKNIENYEVFDSRTFLQKLKLFVRKLLPLHYKVPLASRLLLLAYSKEDICTRLALLNKKDVICVKYNVKKIFPNTYHISRK